MILQFADDTKMFGKATTEELAAAMIILRTFSCSSGINISFSISAFTCLVLTKLK